MKERVKLLAFAGARDAIGAAELAFELPGPCTAAQLLGLVCEAHPALSPYRRALRVAINGTYARDDERVADGDEVALIPPVSGG